MLTVRRYNKADGTEKIYEYDRAALNLYITPELKDRIMRSAAREGLPMTKYIAQTLEPDLEPPKKLFNR